MGRPAGWMTALTGRSPMKSPGAPAHRREAEREFWREIAKGLLAEEAALAVGVSQAVGSRWFRHRGGMPIDLGPLSGRYLTFREREEIAILKAQDAGVRQIALQLGRAPSTISRELRRNAATRGGKLEYRASVAQWKAELVAQRPRTAKLAGNDRLREYVQERLSGQVRRPDGTPVAGPATAPWKGRNKPHRGDRKWVTAWSPEQIASRLKVDFPDDESMRISHEAIYQALYVESRGALKRDLVACLRTGRALRVPRARSRVLFRLRSSRSSADSWVVTPGLTPSSTSASLSQRCRQDSEIPKSFAIWDSGASPLRATATTSRRNSRGNAFGMLNILPARNTSSQARSQPIWGQSRTCLHRHSPRSRAVIDGSEPWVHIRTRTRPDAGLAAEQDRSKTHSSVLPACQSYCLRRNWHDALLHSRWSHARAV